MQFERLRKNHKKKIIIGGLILVCVISAITITTTRAKYKLTQNLKLAEGNVNYKSYDFKVIAMYQSDDKVNYTEINEMPSEGYRINESKSYCNMSNGNKDTTAILKTINGNHTIGKLKKNDRCYLYFDKINNITIDNIIASVNPKNTPPNFANVATTDEGVYKVEDIMYGENSYYWRGAVTNNYVKFANKCWRIVRINGDKTMRLIYDGKICHANGTPTVESIAVKSQKYHTSDNYSYYVGWTSGSNQRTLSGTPSNAKTQLESWYNSNLASQTERIADGKYCNDRNVASGYKWGSSGSDFYYAGYDRSGVRSESSVYPTLSCDTGDVYTLKIGTISMDEVVMAGGDWRKENRIYYLYNGQNYWTMSPGYWSGVYAGVFCVNSDGYLSWANVNSAYGLRPVINLKVDTLFQAGGNGTLNNPYVVV